MTSNNPKQEKKPCYGCKGLTERNEIFLECFSCDGDGYVESDDWQDNGRLVACHECVGKGGVVRNTFYCCQECRDYSIE